MSNKLDPHWFGVWEIHGNTRYNGDIMTVTEKNGAYDVVNQATKEVFGQLTADPETPKTATLVLPKNVTNVGTFADSGFDTVQWKDVRNRELYKWIKKHNTIEEGKENPNGTRSGGKLTAKQEGLWVPRSPNREINDPAIVTVSPNVYTYQNENERKTTSQSNNNRYKNQRIPNAADFSMPRPIMRDENQQQNVEYEPRARPKGHRSQTGKEKKEYGNDEEDESVRVPNVYKSGYNEKTEENKKKFYTPHLTEEECERAIKDKYAYVGEIHISKFSPANAFFIGKLENDIRVIGQIDQNRCFEGDTVLVSLYPFSEWFSKESDEYRQLEEKLNAREDAEEIEELNDIDAVADADVAVDVADEDEDEEDDNEEAGDDEADDNYKKEKDEESEEKKFVTDESTNISNRATEEVDISADVKRNKVTTQETMTTTTATTLATDEKEKKESKDVNNSKVDSKKVGLVEDNISEHLSDNDNEEEDEIVVIPEVMKREEDQTNESSRSLSVITNATDITVHTEKSLLLFDQEDEEEEKRSSVPTRNTNNLKSKNSICQWEFIQSFPDIDLAAIKERFPAPDEKPDFRARGKVVAVFKEKRKKLLSHVCGYIQVFSPFRRYEKRQNLIMLIPLDKRIPKAFLTHTFTENQPKEIRKLLRKRHELEKKSATQGGQRNARQRPGRNGIVGRAHLELKEQIDTIDKQLRDYIIDVNFDPDWPETKRYPSCQFLKALGYRGKIDIETEIILKMNDIYYNKFSKEVEDSVATLNVTSKDFENRKDLRKERIFTIDPTTAKDFDDALSIETLSDNKFRIGIHIADVSHFVTPGSLVDDEARRRTTSICLVDRVLSMLPRHLSTNLCSLNPDVDRLAFS